MKKGIIAFGIIGFASMLIFAQQQPEKRYNVQMTMQEWQAVVNIIDNSATPGDVRKALIGSIQYQVNAQLKSDTSKVAKPKSDTTATKKKPN